MMLNNMTLGQRLKRRISEKGITQKQLSEMVKIPETTISGYFRDFREPDIRTIILIADALDTTVEYIVTGKKINKSQLIGELAATLEEPKLRAAYQKLLELNEDNLELAAGQLDVIIKHQQKK